MSQHLKLEKSMKQPFWKNWVLYVILVFGIILSFMFFRLSNTIENLSHNAIDKSLEVTINELNSFFSPFVRNVKLAREWGSSGQLNIKDLETMNKRFVPVLRNYPQISSMLVGCTSGCEYMLLNEDSTWLNRKTTAVPQKEVRKIRWKYANNLFVKVYDEEWVERKNYDPRLRPWFTGALLNPNDSFPAWTSPYIFATTGEPGITASYKFSIPNDSNQYVIAYDLKLFDISLFTTQMNVSENGKLFIFTEDSLVIGLPKDKKFFASAAIKSNVLKPIDSLSIPVISSIFKEWNSINKQSAAFSSSFENEKWWSSVVEYPLNGQKKLYIAVLVPESDFVAEVKQTRTIILIGFFLVFLMSLVVVNNFNQKRKANLLLEAKNVYITQQKEEIEAQRDEIDAQRNFVVAQKEHIEEQKKEIEDSILYAKRIQNAVLPDGDYAKEILKDYFIIFKPKDVVSGDFYYTTQVGNWLIVAVADCTGHGVPGAFMSMLGMSFLNEIIRKKEVTNAAEILNHLRSSIVEALKQTGASGTQKDGMDISLLAINYSDNTFYWAGANNPLYIIRNKEGEYQLEEIKGDKMPVAIHVIMEPFTNQMVDLKKGDRIYLISDGMPDQFGGPKGKKFMSKTLKELFVETASLPIQTQGNRVERELEKWMNDYGSKYEQIDDITLLGLQI